MANIKPCPFCGSSNAVLVTTRSIKENVRVVCLRTYCEAEGPKAKNELKAIEKWNNSSRTSTSQDESTQNLDETFYETESAAKLLNLSPRTLEKWRATGGGPIYLKFGGKVVYAVSDLRAWAQSKRRESTERAQ